MNRIQEILDKQGRSQVWLEPKISRGICMLNMYCKNKKQPPLFVAQEIADALGVEVSELSKKE